jgi:AraC-like DNA-binding protein
MASARVGTSDPTRGEVAVATGISPVHRWSTRGLPQSERLDYFASALSEALIPISVEGAAAAGFQAEVSCASLGAIDVVRVDASPYRSFRGTEELSRSTYGGLHLWMVLTTTWSADHRGMSRLAAGDILIHDSRYPFNAEIYDSFSAISISLSEKWLRQWIPNPNVLAAHRIPVSSLWGRALASYVAELRPEFVEAPPLPLSVISDQVGSLLALAAVGLRSTTTKYTPATRSLHERIHEVIVQRCTEPHLTAADVAGSLSISLRTLHRTFAAANETFGAMLIEARVRVAIRMLTSPSFNRVTTAEIGRRAGFISASHFARVVRKHTGQTPLQARRTDTYHEDNCES